MALQSLAKPFYFTAQFCCKQSMEKYIVLVQKNHSRNERKIFWNFLYSSHPFGAGLVKKFFFKNIRNNLYNKHVVKTFRQCIYNENHLYFIFYYMFDNWNDYEIVSLYFVAIQAFTRTQAIVSTYSKQFKLNSDTKSEILLGLFKSHQLLGRLLELTFQNKYEAIF